MKEQEGQLEEKDVKATETLQDVLDESGLVVGQVSPLWRSIEFYLKNRGN